MSSPLFRPEAIKNNTQRLLGDVLLLRPISFWVFTIVIALIVVLVGTLLFFGTFARRESVEGYLVPDKGLVRVYAPFNGVIDKKHITDGQKVNKGQDLLEVITERGTKDSMSTNEQMIYRLHEQRSNLEQRILDETRVQDSENSRLTLLLSNHKNEYYRIQQQLQSQLEQLRLTKLQWSKYEELRSKKLISEDELIARRNTYYDAKASVDAIKRIRINKRSEITNIEKQLEQSPLQKDNRLKELQNQISTLDQRLIELRNGRSYMLKAPVNGRIASTQVYIGQHVSSTIPVLTIIPENTILHAELFLPSRAIGFVQKDQKVLIRYDAFPYQRYGLHEGKIVDIAEVVINPNQVQVPLALQEPVYQIKVALDLQTIMAYGKEMPLQSGMSVAADIILEERSLGQWLLEPIYSLRGKL